MPLGSGFLEVRDQVRSVLGLLEPGEHLSTRGPSKLSTAVLCRSQEEEQHRRGVAEADAEQSQTKQPQLRSAACTAAGGAQRAEPSGRAEEGVRTILVPGMYAFGLSRYMYRCSSHHVMPVAKRR